MPYTRRAGLIRFLPIRVTFFHHHTMHSIKPNLIFILADDLGSADLGCYGGKTPFPVSPHLDALAANGLRFSDAYSNSSVCSPTRFAMMSGRYQYRLRGAAEEPLSGNAPGSTVLGLPPDHPTHASLLKAAGYRTALIGKWHLGFPPHFGPRKSGFDYFYGGHSGAQDYFTHKDSRGNPDLLENEQVIQEEGYFTDLLTARACRWISEQNEAAPFLLNLHYTAPHWPWEAREDEAEAKRLDALGLRSIFHTDGGSLDTYWRMIHHMDEGIGKIVALLKARGQLDNTLIVFTSDNGGERFSNNWPFVGGKMDLTEGGIRVPAIAHWPLGIAQAAIGKVAGLSHLTMDWTASLLAAAGVAADPHYPLDGISLLPSFQDPAWAPPRNLYWRMKHRSQKALRQGPWKYLSVDSNEYLFNIEVDQRERANLAKRYPDRLASMRDQWENWSRTMPAIPDDAMVNTVYTPAEIPKATY
jgi:arylsulfatase A-like enzyme